MTRPQEPEIMVTSSNFRAELKAVLASAQERGAPYVDITSGPLHRRVGNYPGNNHRMPVCCDVMRGEMKYGDEILRAPPKGNGATLTIRYRLPRKSKRSLMLEDRRVRTDQGSQAMPSRLHHKGPRINLRPTPEELGQTRPKKPEETLMLLEKLDIFRIAEGRTLMEELDQMSIFRVLLIGVVLFCLLLSVPFGLMALYAHFVAGPSAYE